MESMRDSGEWVSADEYAERRHYKNRWGAYKDKERGRTLYLQERPNGPLLLWYSNGPPLSERELQEQAALLQRDALRERSRAQSQLPSGFTFGCFA